MNGARHEIVMMPFFADKGVGRLTIGLIYDDETR